MTEVNGHTAVLQTWLDQLRHGDGATSSEARNQLLRHAGDRLETLARQMLRRYPRLRRWEQTGDVLQNAVLRLYRSLAAIKPESPRQFYGLAAAQLRRELIDLGRHHFGPEGAAGKHLSDDHSEMVANAAEADGEPSTLADWTEFHEMAHRLPEAEREVFDLLWYEGVSQKEAADLLNVTERTIKARWRSTKLILRRLLRDEAPE
jgi:RNA polymerase sigma-70 factor (ECF subfamily)